MVPVLQENVVHNGQNYLPAAAENGKKSYNKLSFCFFGFKNSTK
jgi:hypothetical protein